DDGPLHSAAGSGGTAADRRTDWSRCDCHGGEAPHAMTPLTGCLLISAILVLIGIELMLNAANLNFIAFWRYGPHPEALTGVLFVIFSIAIAAAEAAVGLALILAVYRHTKITDLGRLDSMKG